MPDRLNKDAVLRVGEVSEVNGRKIHIKVDKNKNLTDVFFDGDILKNISVNSFIEIRKGFLSIIGKVEGEKISDDFRSEENSQTEQTNRNSRFLIVSLSGYISQSGTFIAGTKELPLIGNEAYIVTKNKIEVIHNLIKNKGLSINIATSDNDDFEIAFPIDGLFNSHIAIFGNTGSGKSNTLASLYQETYKALNKYDPDFKNNCRFLLFDFNGEYAEKDCIFPDKKVYNLSTRTDSGDKIPIDENNFLDIEILSILSDATEKTQKPLLKRAISLYLHLTKSDDPLDFFKNLLKKKVTHILGMSDKIQAYLLLDYVGDILPKSDDFDVRDGLEWHNTSNEFKNKNTNAFLSSSPDQISTTPVYQKIDQFSFSENIVSKLISFLYLQLISDVISNRTQNEHVAPVINKLKSKQNDIEKIFKSSSQDGFWDENFVVINLNDVNLDMKKTIPLLLSKKVYSEHKNENNQKSLNIIIDEAHNILSKESFREAESWKDYRLETFEEIIKEGRKFGVFVTISSQRPNDISPTITSQAHNYFIHRLINQKDLMTISNAVSYIDKISEESIPTLPTGTCIFSGVASQMPLKVNIKPLAENLRPKSRTLEFQDILKHQTATKQ